MFVLASRQVLLERIAAAAQNEQAFGALRDFVFDYYWDEDDYIFESDEVEWIFAVLLPYLQVEEALGDPHRCGRMAILLEALTQDFTPQSALLGLEHDRIAVLVQKYRDGLLRAHLFRKKIEDLTPARIDKSKLFEAVASRWLPELMSDG